MRNYIILFAFLTLGKVCYLLRNLKSMAVNISSVILLAEGIYACTLCTLTILFYLRVM
jgi:hypothetical protein